MSYVDQLTRDELRAELAIVARGCLEAQKERDTVRAALVMVTEALNTLLGTCSPATTARLNRLPTEERDTVFQRVTALCQHAIADPTGKEAYEELSKMRERLRLAERLVASRDGSGFKIGNRRLYSVTDGWQVAEWTAAHGERYLTVDKREWTSPPDSAKRGRTSSFAAFKEWEQSTAFSDEYAALVALEKLDAR